MGTIGDRIQQLIDDLYKRSAAAFAREIGVSANTVLNYVNKEKESKPTQPVLEAIVRKTGVDAKWLLTGEGVPFPEDSARTQQQHQVEGGAFQAQGVLVEQIRDIKIEADPLPAPQGREANLKLEVEHLRQLLSEKDARIAEKEARISDLQQQLQDKREDIAELRTLLKEERSRYRS